MRKNTPLFSEVTISEERR